jgi:hypothetical protein
VDNHSNNVEMKEIDPICLRKMGCNCIDCGQFNTVSINHVTEVSEKLKQDGWLKSQLENMLKPEAALGDVAMPLSKVLSELTVFADKDDSSRHSVCQELNQGNNILMLVQLCVGASDYLRWLAL